MAAGPRGFLAPWRASHCIGIVVVVSSGAFRLSGSFVPRCLFGFRPAAACSWAAALARTFRGVSCCAPSTAGGTSSTPAGTSTAAGTSSSAPSSWTVVRCPDLCHRRLLLDFTPEQGVAFP